MKNEKISELLEVVDRGSFNGGQILLKRSTFQVNSSLKLFAYQATLNFNSRVVKGFGSDFAETSAALKAVVELFERLSFEKISNATSSSGLAAHVSFDQAAKNAALELVERDLFLCHYLTSEPILDQTQQGMLASREFSTSRSALLERGFDLRLGLMHQSQNFSAYFCALFDMRNGGCIVGSSCKPKASAAINKALCEVLANFGFMRNENVSSITKKDFENLAEVTLMDHFRLGLGSETGQRVKALLDPKGKFSTDESVFFESMHVEPVELDGLFSGIPLKICYAKNLALQTMFFGLPTESKVNLMRISQFLGRDVEFSELEQHAHPFN